MLFIYLFIINFYKNTWVLENWRPLSLAYNL